MGDSREAGECPEVVWSGDELDWVKPRGAREYLRGVGYRYLRGYPFDDGYERLLREYRPSRRYKLALILPCSYGKPYSQSYIHYLIRSRIAGYIKKGVVHEVIVTNAGVVPRELDEHWPYTAYDWNPGHETQAIRECYRRVLAERLRGYMEKYSSYYERWAAYLRWDSDSWKAVVDASRSLGIEIVNLAPRSVPWGEVEEAGLGLGYDSDPDIILVTRTGLGALASGLEELLGAPHS
ncbi:MAG: DUF5591 domain-containing protein [Desulfurococcales archaeon]|nr:DUF5591 domain-containing protein [Desulfurococcales archaeon]